MYMYPYSYPYAQPSPTTMPTGYDYGYGYDPYAAYPTYDPYGGYYGYPWPQPQPLPPPQPQPGGPLGPSGGWDGQARVIDQGRQKKGRWVKRGNRRVWVY